MANSCKVCCITTSGYSTTSNQLAVLKSSQRASKILLLTTKTLKLELVKLQRGFSPIILVISVFLVLAAILGGAVYLGKKVSLGQGPGTAKPQEPPDSAITFAKSVNINADQFTQVDISKAKEMGANMVTIWPARFIRNDEFILAFPERLAPMINFAHKNGLQVELRNSFTGEQITDYENWRTNALKHIAQFAKFAQKSKVYRIVPFGEIDNNLMNYCAKITALSKELLEEARKHYSGQIGVGIAAPWRDCGYEFTGYDYLTISAYAQSRTGTNAWLTSGPDINVYNVISGARKVAERSNIKILHVGETGVINPEDTKREDFASFAMEGKQKETEFYEKFFGLISDKVNGLSVFYNSRMDYMSVNGDPAEEVVREWYTKL